MSFKVRIKPLYQPDFTHHNIDVDLEFEVLVSSEHDTFIVWQPWQSDHRCYVLNRREVDIV